MDESAAPYRSLYRRYRPRRFDEVLGQEHVTRALRNAVRDGKAAHAYLFSGPRGTGKTSTARILAMALNCEHPDDGEPDGTCASCVAIRSGASVDVHELDAASNRRLDEMRDLLGRVALGTSGRQKVYIIDEVHQLTTDASTALLKTLEEPPAHVVFVLATTDPQKVLPTIRSRTQHFEFRLLSSETLAGLLSDVNDRAGLGVAREAIDLVVRRGRGSARDALSVLDQVAAAGSIEDEGTVVSDIVEAIAERDSGRVLLGVAQAVTAGRDPRRLAVDLLEHLRNGFLAIQARSLVMLADDATDVVEAQAHQLGLPTVVRALEVIGQAVVDMRDSVDPRITLEVALVRLASPAADHSPAALAQRIDALERATSTAGPAPHPPPEQPSGPRPPPVPAVPSSPPPQPVAQAQAEPPPPAPSSPPSRPVTPRPAGTEGRVTARPPQAAVPVGDAPPLPSRARTALGAHRRSPGPDQAPASAPAPGSEAPHGSGPAPVASAEAPPSPAAPAGAGSLPSRDELTTAWGDRILGGLRPGVRVYFAPGRFVSVDGGAATFALPDQGLLSRAQPLRGEAEAALTAAFGRPIPLRLVIDDGAVPSPGEPPSPEDPSDYDLDTLEDAGPALVSPEQRLLQAFPGAEEVAP